MARKQSAFPTEGEVEILGKFWNGGTLTVRDVHDRINKTRPVSFTTVATMVRIMVAKKQLKMTDVRRPQKFEAVATREKVAGAYQKFIDKRILAAK